MGIFARHFLALFLVRFAGAFLVVQLFVGLLAVLGFMVRHPGAPPGVLLSGLPDLVLLFLPLSLPFCCAVAGCLFVREVRHRGGFLAVELAGRDPRRLQGGILAVGAALSALLLWLTADILPQAEFLVRRDLLAAPDAPQRFLLRFAGEPEALPGARVGFEGVDGDSLRGFSMATVWGPSRMAITARAARYSPAGEAPFVGLELEGGRILRLDREGRLTTNASFDALRAEWDATAFAGQGKTGIRDLKNYTNEELDLLPDQLGWMLHHGIEPSGSQRLRVGAGPFVKMVRVQASLLPFLVLALVVAHLGTHAVRGTTLRTALVLLFCLGFLLPHTLVLDHRARTASLGHPWEALIPTAEAVLGLLLGFLDRGRPPR